MMICHALKEFIKKEEAKVIKNNIIRAGVTCKCMSIYMCLGASPVD